MMKKVVVAFSMAALLIGCGSAHIVSGLMAPAYQGQTIRGASLAIVPWSNSVEPIALTKLEKSGPLGLGPTVEGDTLIVPEVEDFNLELMTALARSIEESARFQSVTVIDFEDRPATTTRGLMTHPRRSNRPPVDFDIPAERDPLEHDGAVPAVILLVTTLEAMAGHHTSSHQVLGAGGHPIGSVSNTKPGIGLAIRYVWWDNQRQTVISWGDFSFDAITKLSSADEARSIETWVTAVDQLAGAMLRNTPFRPAGGR